MLTLPLIWLTIIIIHRVSYCENRLAWLLNWSLVSQCQKILTLTSEKVLGAVKSLRILRRVTFAFMAGLLTNNYLSTGYELTRRYRNWSKYSSASDAPQIRANSAAVSPIVSLGFKVKMPGTCRPAAR